MTRRSRPASSPGSSAPTAPPNTTTYAVPHEPETHEAAPTPENTAPPDAAFADHARPEPTPAHPAPAFDAKAIRKVIRAGRLDDARRLIDDGRKATSAAKD